MNEQHPDFDLDPSQTPEPEAQLAPKDPEVPEFSAPEASLQQEATDAVEQMGAAESPVHIGEAAADDDGEEAEQVWSPEPDKLLLSLLFASHEYLSSRAIRDIMGEDWDVGSIRRLVKTVNARLEEQGMPFEVMEVDSTFRIRTRTQYFPWVRKLFREANPRRLSQASLETLAIIAYKQPITKAEIEAIRGVNVDGCMKSLLEKKLVDVNGRTDAMGNAFTYSTTRDFMRYFGISRVPDDLPRLSEFEAIVNAQALIPQVAADGTMVEMAQPDPEAEQMSMGEME